MVTIINHCVVADGMIITSILRAASGILPYTLIKVRHQISDQPHTGRYWRRQPSAR